MQRIDTNLMSDTARDAYHVELIADLAEHLEAATNALKVNPTDRDAFVEGLLQFAKNAVSDYNLRK